MEEDHAMSTTPTRRSAARSATWSCALVHAVSALAATLTPALAPSVAKADELEEVADPIETARQNFKQGLELEKQGDFAAALAKFEAVAQVKATPQVRFHVAVCQEKLGKLASALASYEAAGKQAQSEGNAPEVLKVAPELAEKLRPRVPKLMVVHGPDDVPTGVVLDGKPLALDALAEILLDPGPHTIVASKGSEEIKRDFTVAEGDKKRLVLDFKHAELVVYESPAEKPKEKTKDLGVEDPGQTRRTIGWVLAGTGVASAIATGVFLGVRASAINDLETACDGELRCPAAAQDSLDHAKTFTTLSRIGVGVSVVTLATGLVLVFTNKKPSESPQTARLSPWAPQGSVGFGLQGVF
jgi:hypothetical protein